MEFFRPLIAGLLVAAALRLGNCKDNSGDAAKPGGDGGGEKVTGPIKIGFIVKQPEQTWFQNEWKFAEQAAAKDGFELIKIGATDGPKTLAAIDTLAGQGAQGFIVCVPDAKLGQAILDRAARANLKVMSVDDRFKDADGKDMVNVHHMGITARDIGKLVGTALADEMKKRGWKPEETGAAILTHNETESHRDRTDGETEALVAGGLPKDHVYAVAEREPLGLPTGRDAMNACLTQQTEVKHWLIAGINDESVIGAVRATESRQLSAANVAAVGIGGDASRSELEAPQATGVIASVLISPKRHGYETADLMYQWIHDGKEPPMVTWTQGILINRDNYKQIIHEQGLD